MKNYEDEVIDIKFIFPLTIFVVVNFYVICDVIIEYKNGICDFFILCLLVAFLGVIEIVFDYILFANIINGFRNRKIVKEIKENGKKVRGIVKSIQTSYNDNRKNTYFKRASFFRRIGTSRYRAGDNEIYYFAQVKCEIDGVKKNIQSPSLNFYNKGIIGHEVDIYFYNGMYYIDNYYMPDDKKVVKKIYKILLY